MFVLGRVYLLVVGPALSTKQQFELLQAQASTTHITRGFVFATVNLVRDILFAILQFSDAFLDTVLHDKLSHANYRSCLTNTMDAVDTLDVTKHVRCLRWCVE